MIQGKNLVALLTAIGTLLISATDKAPAMIKWVVMKDCSVTVNGSTNINKFSCGVAEYNQPDTVTCYKNTSDPSVNLSGRLTIPVISFDCNNAMMTHDLRKTLKAKEFPVLNVYFVSLEKYPELHVPQEPVTGTVIIELAGVSRKIGVNYRFTVDDQKIIRLVGTQTIKFSDFLLTPPRKLGGMIRADDRLDVIFRLNFKNISSP